ncbi:hypothetical protein KAFR_0B05430 [Kazachstania africana CBS 2517]|uniref:tRNA (guanine(26)-N(2))-dimethyltransferase n=1 Tax=Kazachstania africana (strain ATCC 22294 / BCRC 22015 / CBS 2517 / CECT 1963 / NBRC 1671 / NRRL Y-8276) TaxID=1071382 RepID=H2AR38_KAZAF|nr:hypothetical protein KAFR_0B05430 [Kazachstania africana CBS 2517]CCF56838.1 hypothetical protein KAFR_0B05430 [Kazachstania africana CBS 2517]
MLRSAINKIKSSFLQKNIKAAAKNNIKIEDFKIVKEGSAEILFPKKEDVFYNPIQQFNRDLSVMCIKAWDKMYRQEAQTKGNKRSKSSRFTSKKRKLEDGSTITEEIKEQDPEKYMRILEALSATGLRAIRYAKEIPNVKELVANDLIPAAVDSIQRNISFNEVDHLVKANLDDANALLYREKGQNNRFHVIDLDPYGTVTPFIDAALQNIEENGLLLVTCTDLSVLAGNGYPEKCFALYGGVNMVNHEATHESALRLVLNLINQTAAKYKKTVTPLLSLSIDFYVRVFVQVKTSPIEVKSLQSKTMITYHCTQCGSYHNQPLGRKSEVESKKKKNITQFKYSVAQGPPVDRKCRYCQGTYHLAGPMYAGPLHNEEFVKEVLKINKEDEKKQEDIYGTHKRIEGMLTLALNEVADSPFYFSPNHVSSILKLQVPQMKKVIAGLGSLGFQCSLTHAQPSSIKTNAPWEAIWYVMRQCDSEKDVSRMNPNTAGYKILSTMSSWLPSPSDEIKSSVFFDSSKLSFEENEQSGNVEKLRKLKIVRYQENPTKNWGPKARPNPSTKPSPQK